jgi:integrase/recombinase XerD
MPRQIALVKDTENDDLDQQVASWTRTLKAERKAGDTIRSYLAGVSAFAAWCEAQGRPIALDPDTVTDWSGAMLAAGRAPATVIARQRGVRRFSAWLAGKKITEADLIDRIRPPKLDEPLVPALTDAQLRALLGTCKGPEFQHVRDKALITFMYETAARAAETVDMELADVNLDECAAIIRRGKGGKGRLVPISPQCAAMIDDYLRLRRRHRLAKAGSTALWLGARGRELSYFGLYNSIQRRGEAAGLGDIHPHVLRHTGAVRWLDAGGSTTGLLAVAGWTSIDMLRRYIRASEGNLAAKEARDLNLNLGDV